MKRTKRTEIVVEKDQVLVIRKLGRRAPEWCEACGEPSRMLTVDEAAAIRRVSARVMYQQAETAQVHFMESEDGRLFICLSSLLGRTPIKFGQP
jgi:hypothetical protein